MYFGCIEITSMKSNSRLFGAFLLLILSTAVSYLIGDKAAFSLLGGGLFTLGVFRAYKFWFTQQDASSKPSNINSGVIALMALLLLSGTISFLVDFSTAFVVMSSGTFVACLMSVYHRWNISSSND